MLLAVALVAYGLDQVTKVLAVEHLTGRAPVRLVGELLQLRLHRNPGAAFGLAEGATVLLSVVAVVVAVAILRAARNLRDPLWAVSLGLLLGGALGNLTDRLVRSPAPLRGHVVDFLELPNWPIFNVADMAIVGGAALAVVLTMLGRNVDGSRANARDEERRDAGAEDHGGEGEQPGRGEDADTPGSRRREERG